MIDETDEERRNATTLRHSLKLAAEHAGKCKAACDIAIEKAREKGLTNHAAMLTEILDVAAEVESALRAIELPSELALASDGKG